MLRILDRYIFREVAQTWAAVTLVLLFILLTNQFARVLGDVAKDRLPKDAVFQVIGLTGLQYLTIVIPIGLFLSIMLALGRLYRDSEMPAMMACRVGPGGIYRPLMWLVIPLSLAVGWLATDLGPKALTAVDRIGVEAKREADLASIEPGTFTAGSDGTVVYAERVIGPGSVENVFLQRRTESGGVEVVIADRGEQMQVEDADTRYFVLHDGRRYEGMPGTSEFLVMEFAEHGIPYRLPDVSDADERPRAMSTLDLMKSGSSDLVAELQWRIGVPLSTLILGILAVPLSRSQPRQGRYGRLAVGLLVFIIYFNLLSAGKSWVEQEAVPAAVGLWWVHGIMIAMAAGMLASQSSVFRRIVSFRGR
ncbi:MAG: LPS export ABC transporter permease LptF [Gammaproteobacteria bacterium]